MELAAYHELPHYTNIYSLSSYEYYESSGCLLSTSRTLYQVHCVNSTLQLTRLSYPKLPCEHYSADCEVLGHASHPWAASLVTAILYRYRTGISGLMIGKREMKDQEGTNEHTVSLDLPYSPLKVTLVMSLYRVK